MSLGLNIKKLRSNAKLTQSEFAELFGVSHQSVQKWESGETKPDLDNIMKISAHFGITVDALLFDTLKRAEENTKSRELIPSYVDSAGWEAYTEHLMTEYQQCIDEGLDVSRYKGVFQGISELEVGKYKRKLADVVFDIVLNADNVNDYKYDEPSEIDAIRRASEGVRGKLPTYRPTDFAIGSQVRGMDVSAAVWQAKILRVYAPTSLQRYCNHPEIILCTAILYQPI